MITASKTTVVAILASLALAACGSGLSEEDAARAFGTMNGQLSSGQTQAQVNPNGLTTADQTDQTYNIDLSTSCPEGGTLALVGSMSTYESAFEFDFDSTFTACKSDNIITDGNLNFALSMSGTDTSSFIYNFTYQGNLSFSGDIEGDCEIDVTGTVSMSGMTYSGTVCGYEADETINTN